MRSDWSRRSVVLLCVTFSTMLNITEHAQAQAAPPPASVGQQAASAVLKHYDVNPAAKVLASGQPLPLDGDWYVGKTTPASCPQSPQPRGTCVEVFYAVPAQEVKCSWVVLLNADGSDGTFLGENDDAARYLLRKVAKNEAKDLVVSRSKPVYPAIAIAAHVAGVVTLRGQVDKTGTVIGLRVLSGPAMLQQASLEGANKWKFKPLLVGAVAVPYEIEFSFTFRVQDSQMHSVEMAP